MKKYKINPKVEIVNCIIEVGIDLLQTEGWDFDNIHENTSNVLGISFEDAEQKNLREYTAWIKLESAEANPIENILTSWWWQNHDNGNTTDTEDTGDDEQTVKDIISLLNDGLIKIDDDYDLSTDNQGEYTPTFIEID